MQERERKSARIIGNARLSIASVAWDIRERRQCRKKLLRGRLCGRTVTPRSYGVPIALGYRNAYAATDAYRTQAPKKLKTLTSFKCIGFETSRRGSLAVADTPCRRDGQHVRANAQQSRE
jgi:hypothetical protein